METCRKPATSSAATTQLCRRPGALSRFAPLLDHHRNCRRHLTNTDSTCSDINHRHIFIVNYRNHQREQSRFFLFFLSLSMIRPLFVLSIRWCACLRFVFFFLSGAVVLEREPQCLAGTPSRRPQDRSKERMKTLLWGVASSFVYTFLYLFIAAQKCSLPFFFYGKKANITNSYVQAGRPLSSLLFVLDTNEQMRWKRWTLFFFSSFFLFFCERSLLSFFFFFFSFFFPSCSLIHS